MFYVVKQGNEYNVVSESLLKETDDILFTSPSAEACWNYYDEYVGGFNDLQAYIESMLLNQTIVKGDD